MPIYEYKCTCCAERFERFLSIQDMDVKQSCICGCEETVRLISRCSFVYEGSEHRDIDCIVGADAERKWQNIYARKSNRDKERQKKESRDKVG